MSSRSHFHTFVRIIQPSLLSSVATAIISLVLALVLLAPSLYRGSDFALYFDSLNIRETTGYEEYQLVSNAINTSELAANISVFVAWMMIGFIAYSIVLSLVKVVGSIIRFVRDVEYFKADRNRIALEASVHLGIRVGAALTLYGLYLLFMKFGLTYIFVFAHQALSGSLLTGAWYVFLMGLIVACGVHVFVILARLALLRIRVFYDRYFAADA